MPEPRKYMRVITDEKHHVSVYHTGKVEIEESLIRVYFSESSFTSIYPDGVIDRIYCHMEFDFPTAGPGQMIKFDPIDRGKLLL